MYLIYIAYLMYPGTLRFCILLLLRYLTYNI